MHKQYTGNFFQNIPVISGKQMGVKRLAKHSIYIRRTRWVYRYQSEHAFFYKTSKPTTMSIRHPTCIPDLVPVVRVQFLQEQVCKQWTLDSSPEHISPASSVLQAQHSTALP